VSRRGGQCRREVIRGPNEVNILGKGLIYKVPGPRAENFMFLGNRNTVRSAFVALGSLLVTVLAIEPEAHGLKHDRVSFPFLRRGSKTVVPMS
jgi:hypothetical protein